MFEDQKLRGRPSECAFRIMVLFFSDALFSQVQHNLLQIKGQIFPFDGSENAFANNEYLSDLIRKMMRTFNYTAQTPLLISTNVQPNR